MDQLVRTGVLLNMNPSVDSESVFCQVSGNAIPRYVILIPLFVQGWIEDQSAVNILNTEG